MWWLVAARLPSFPRVSCTILELLPLLTTFWFLRLDLFSFLHFLLLNARTWTQSTSTEKDSSPASLFQPTVYAFPSALPSEFALLCCIFYRQHTKVYFTCHKQGLHTLFLFSVLLLVFSLDVSCVKWGYSIWTWYAFYIVARDKLGAQQAYWKSEQSSSEGSRV